MNNAITSNAIMDKDDIGDELNVKKNTVGRPSFDNEAAGQPIICGFPTEEPRRIRLKNKIKVAILQLRVFTTDAMRHCHGASQIHLQCGIAYRTRETVRSSRCPDKDKMCTGSCLR